jgi:hypothetical protein
VLSIQPVVVAVDIGVLQCWTPTVAKTRFSFQVQIYEAYHLAALLLVWREELLPAL